MWDLRALRSPLMRAKKPRSQAVHEMRGFLRRDALKIAGKLGAAVEKSGKHQKATFFYNDLLIFQFGIRHGTNCGHGHLAGENKILRLSESNAVRFAQCDITFDEYVQMLIDRGVIPRQAPE